MKMPWSKLEGPAKVLVLSATVFLTAAVLCGIQGIIASFHQNPFDDILIISSIIGLIEVGIMGLAVTACVVALLWISARRIFPSYFQHPASQSVVRRWNVSVRSGSKVA